MSEVWEELYEQRDRLREVVRRVSDNEEGRALLIERTHDHERELTANHAAFLELVRLVDRQQERISRLEEIIVSMANGLVTTYPEAGEIHTHQIYLLNGVRELVEEIKSPSPDPPPAYLWGDGNQASKQAGQSRLLGEEPEPDGARYREHIGVCPRCGDACRDYLCLDCESDLAEEQATLGCQTIEDMEYDAEMALHDGQLCDY